VRGNDAFHPLQRLEAALRLARFGGGCAKAIHEGRDLLNALHLPCVQQRQQRQLLGSLLLELRVVAGVSTDTAILDMQYAIDDGVEKLAIMRNHQ